MNPCRRSIFPALFAIPLLFLASGAAAGTGARYILHALTEHATFGLPVVVEIRVENPTEAPVQIFDLADPFVIHVFWEWKSAQDDSHVVGLEHYHYSAVPDPAPPRLVSIEPRSVISYFQTVPTPADRKDQNGWSLLLKIRDFHNPGSFFTSQVDFEVRREIDGGIAGEIGAGLAQAALLEYSREDVLRNSITSEQIVSARLEGRKGDLSGRLIAYSKALLDGEDTFPEWTQLDGEAAEVKALRNYLLLVQNRFEATPTPSTGYGRMVNAVRKADPFHRELRTAFSERTRSDVRYFSREPDSGERQRRGKKDRTR